MTAIGIFGGTFDPIHFGHLRTVTEVALTLKLAQVRWLPAATPPHRPPPAASASQRVDMLRLAVAGQALFTVDTRELERSGRSYTVDTLKSLRAELGAAQPLCLILGDDAFRGIETWDRWYAIPDLAHLVVMQRPHVDAQPWPAPPPWASDRVTADASALHHAPAGRVYFHAVRPQPISATQVRAAIAAGEPVSGRGSNPVSDPMSDLLPKAVADYIRNNHLYISAKEQNASKTSAS